MLDTLTLMLAKLGSDQTHHHYTHTEAQIHTTPHYLKAYLPVIMTRAKESIAQKVNEEEQRIAPEGTDDKVEICLPEVISLNQIKVGDFVYVGTGKSSNHYVAQVTDLEEVEIQLSFTIKSGKQTCDQKRKI